MSPEIPNARRALLGVFALLAIACGGPPEHTSGSAQLELYRLVLSAALDHAELEEATPQLQLNAVRVSPDGVAAPGDRPDHYSPESSPYLIEAAEGLEGVTLLRTPASFELTPPREIFLFSNPTFHGDSVATVGVRASRLTTAGYWGDAWQVRLRWDGRNWAVSEWVKVVHEDGG